VVQGVVDAYKNIRDAIKVPIIVQAYKVPMQLLQKESIDNSGMPPYLLLNFKKQLIKYKRHFLIRKLLYIRNPVLFGKQVFMPLIRGYANNS
jgi:hypothetical protein